MAESFVTDADSAILPDVLNLALKDKAIEKTDTGELPSTFSNYLNQIVRFATGDDTNWCQPEFLLNRAATSWAIGAKRAPGQSIVELSVKTIGGGKRPRLILDIVSEDKPFIVDSISALLADAGKPVSFFANTVVDIYRDKNGVRLPDASGIPSRESYIHAEMDPPVSEDEITILREEIDTVLLDVNEAVCDWEPMRARLAACFARMERSRIPGIESEEQKEAITFLKWLWDNRFVFLGVRSYRVDGKGDNLVFTHEPENDLGVLRDPNRRVLKATFEGDGRLSEPVSDFLNSNEPIIIAKGNAKSNVHRRAYMDYVGVKVYGIDGQVVGEERFLGLMGSDAYNHPATQIPLIRAKVEGVITGTGFNLGGHNEKALVNILETFPRDELFQIDEDQLRETGLGILRLYKRPRVELFLRRDRFDRFISAIVFVPRDYFSSDTRRQIGSHLAKTYEGSVASFTPFFGDAALVRVHFIIDIDKNAPLGPSVSDLTDDINHICADWNDGLRDAIVHADTDNNVSHLFRKYENAFSEGYKEKNSISGALDDIEAIEALSQKDTVVRVFRCRDDSHEVVRIKIYRRDSFLALSDIIPTIDALGLNLIQETTQEIRLPDGTAHWIHDFCTTHKNLADIDVEKGRGCVEDLILAVLAGRAEDDGFNALALSAQINWREAAFLRTCAKYLIQAGISYSQPYMEECLASNPQIAGELIALMHARFNPNGPGNSDQRRLEFETATARVIDALDDVQSLDQDRIIRRFVNLISATTRTNFFQTNEGGTSKPYISIKIDSKRINDLPQPHPFREIFVSGPRVDGVHLRFGAVARGGLRWSDRREDFRTEVLGLVKAQRVKNAVIVPNGSKGGFYPKQLPINGDRNEIYEEGRESYKVFIRGLLDLTDNIVGDKTISPADSVIWDEPDPYLVVAADKGTAQFSDTANEISQSYGFWLGDAFASGGSAGYDHKAMGITARGAWVAVQRHFREAGKDIQAEPFTVCGVGDMSGDVFGNGMLLSEQIRLIAAFDHRDIFIDPDPEPATSFAERKRLFGLKRSSWADYDKKKISKGGAVISRSAKSAKISEQAAAALGIEPGSITPNELIKAILRARAELFWLGGIGTYFKSSKEENINVGDRANDGVRINIDEARFSVIGEGANLGLTQKARIDFAANGGRINTDAIDNSAGVDSSDHEVNIKILLTSAIENSEIEADNRNALLAAMTDDVADHVLRHNYEQTRALSVMESNAPRDLDLHARFMATLERQDRLDRAIEFLPDTDALNERRGLGHGLYRPELSVLLAYGKLWLFDELSASTAPDDRAFETELFQYFPDELARFPRAICEHQLRREIIATRLSNEVVDVFGINVLQQTVEGAGYPLPTLTLAYEASRRIFGLGAYVSAIDALDNKTPSTIQTDLYRQTTDLLKCHVFKILGDRSNMDLLETNGIEALVAKYSTAVEEVQLAIPDIIPTADKEDFVARRDALQRDIKDETLAQTAARLPFLEHALDIVDLAAEAGWSNSAAGSAYFAANHLLRIDAITARAVSDPPSDHFDRIAMRQVVDVFATRQRQAAAAFIRYIGSEPKQPGPAWIEKRSAQWVESFAPAFKAYERAIGDLDIAGPVSLGKFTLAADKMDEMINAAQE